MTVILQLRPELEERIASEARAQRMSIEAYLMAIIEAAALPAPGERASLEEFNAAMDKMAEGLDDIPVLASEALTRESIYGRRA